MRQRLRGPARLRKKKDFDRVFEVRKVIRGRNFRFYYLRRESPQRYPVRAAFVAGKKIGNSVVRNRVKRVLREAYRRIKGDLSTSTGLDIVIVASRDFARSRSHEVEREMRSLFRRMGTLP